MGVLDELEQAVREVAERVGPSVVGIGRGRGRGSGVVLAFGLVSAVGRAFRGPRGRRIAGSIEHSAPLPRGASGGPVVDAAGRLVGIDTNRLGDGFYLAIRADASLRQRVEALGRGERAAR